MIRLTMGLALALFAGCGDKTEDTSAGAEADADADSDSDADTDADSDADADCESDKVEFTGVAQYADGTTPEGHVRVQMCSDVCVPSFPAGDGAFTFCLDPDFYAFDLVPVNDEGDAGEHYATPLSFMTLSAGQDISLDAPVIIYPYDKKESLQDGEFDAGGGLFIEIDMATFEATLDEPDPGYIGAVAFDFATSGLPLEGVSGTVIASWYLGPVNALVGGWTFRIEGLTPGAQVTIYNADYTFDTVDGDGYGWDDLGTATVGEDGVLHSPKGGGLLHLNTLLLVTP